MVNLIVVVEQPAMEKMFETSPSSIKAGVGEPLYLTMLF